MSPWPSDRVVAALYPALAVPAQAGHPAGVKARLKQGPAETRGRQLQLCSPCEHGVVWEAREGRREGSAAGKLTIPASDWWLQS